MFPGKWPKIPKPSSHNTQTKMKHNTKKNKVQRTQTLNGMMTFGTIENNLHILDFVSTEYVEMEAFTADCRVQAMRDGNVYITERPRRKKGTPLFREDNSTLTLGRDRRYYFVFTLPEDQLDLLSDRLVHQALAIAQKVDKMSAGRIGKK